jgi:FGGY-family pentulose kinase
MARYYLGIDVGTGSARAAVFDDTGKMHGMASQAILIFRPREDFVEHSSEDIWRACGSAVRGALKEAGLKATDIAGIGFDATCSLVLLGKDDEPVTVSPTGKDEHNVIVWMDHRATPQAERINARGHEVLKFAGGTISPEMQTPKLLWLKENLPASWKRAARFLDLPDFLVYRATGEDVRSLCTTVCKWTYLGHAGGWQDSYFEDIGLGDLRAEGYKRIGTRVRDVGDKAGVLTAKAAEELGLAAGTPVAVAIIDAHAGGIGLLGAGDPEEALALIGGTSTCHMAVSREAKYVPGVWGPYFAAMVPGLWLTEGGQSATGALLDHVVFSHARGAELGSKAEAFTKLNAMVAEQAKGLPFPAMLARDVHVLPDHHGNRSPRADPTLRGMISGLKLEDTAEHLAIVYLATVQGIAHGTRHILEAMNAQGYRISTLIATGGDAKNPLFLREHADVTGCKIVLPREPESVLLGSAMLGAVAAGDRATVIEAMRAMASAEKVIEPDARTRAFHDAKHKVFLRMYEDQMAYRALMQL